MFYTIYQITNVINNKTYIGKHQTKNLDDGYFGSGKLLKAAIEKYGKENFKKEILHVFDTEQEMNDKEKELVVIGEQSYNLCPGGNGGFGYINKSGKKPWIFRVNQDSTRREKIRESTWIAKKGCFDPKYDRERNEWRKKSRIRSGTPHTEESKRKIGLANSINHLGEKNPNYGKMWITDGKKNAMIQKVSDIPGGWKRGRTFE